MRIVIPGALGHIGSRALRDLPAHFPGIEIIIVDNLSTQRYCSLFDLPDSARYRFIEADVLEMDLTDLLEGADAVLNLAALTDAAASVHNREEVERVNFGVTSRLADACIAARCPMIHLSSTSVYGTQASVVNEECSEEDLRPQSPYAETKLREERRLMRLGKTEKLQFITCRFGTICGVSTGMRFHTAVNRFCWQAVMNQPLSVWRTALQQKRPYLSLDDAIRAIAFILEHKLFDRRVYNVLMENLTVHEIIEFIRKRVPDLTIEYVDSEIMNQLSYEVSNQRFRDQGFDFAGSTEADVNATIDLLATVGGYRVRK